MGSEQVHLACESCPIWYPVTMFCKACDYNLTGVTANGCPECGRAFDPKDANSFSGVSADQLIGPRRALWIALIIADVGVLLPVPLAYFAALNAQAELGWWPRASRDDPKGLKLDLPFDELFWLFTAVSPFLMLTIIVLGFTAIAAGIMRKRPVWMLWGLLSLAPPVITLSSMVWSYSVEWMLD